MQILLDLYPCASWDVLLEKLAPFRREDIITKACKLHIKRNSYGWSNELRQKVINMYQTGYSIPEIREAIGYCKSESAIYTMLSKRHIGKNFAWTDEEVALLCEAYSQRTKEELCALLPRHGWPNIKWKAHKYGLLHKSWIDRMTNPDYRDLSEYLRSLNSTWKADSAKACNYRCVITGQRYDVIHHIVGFNVIIAETLESLGYEDVKPFHAYTDDELQIIGDTMLQVQASYPLGACMTKEQHLRFHSIYGFGNNTEAQFNEFIAQSNPVTITA